MPVNLLNEKDLNNYLADIVYHGQEMETFKSGDFKSTAFVEQNKDAIVRSMLLQWCKHRLRSHLAEDLPEHREFLTPVTSDEPNLPAWAERCLAENKPIHRFKAEKIPPHLTETIGMIRDYLYSAAENYVNKTLARVKDTKAKGKEEIAPKLRIDYLKTQEAYDTFAKTLSEAQKWHDIMAQKAELRQRDEQMYKASLAGTERVMKLTDGMEIVRLTTPEALDYESEYMGHCVGRGGYDEDVAKGTTKIYSLRDADGMPHATFEVCVNQETGAEEIHQCKGKGNNAPVEKYRPYAQEFVKAQDFELVGDKKNLGLIKQEGKYYDVLHLPKKFVVKGNLYLSDRNLTELPDLSDVIIEGDFHCENNQLTSLKGAPKAVGGSVFCSKNKLISLEGAPQEVNGDFFCRNNPLTSLKGAPQTVGRDFDCTDNYLFSLKGGPKRVGRSFWCCHINLISLEGAPQIVGENFECYGNQLTSLEGAPEEVGGSFCCQDNQLTSLKGAPRVVGGIFSCHKNQITSFKYLPECSQVSSDINVLYVPHAFESLPYEEIEKSPLFRKEKQEMFQEKRSASIPKSNVTRQQKMNLR